MIKNLPDLELRKTVANGFADSSRKLVSTKQQDGQFHKLLASPKSKNSENDQTVQKRTDEFNDARGIRISSSNRSDDRERHFECTAGEIATSATTAPAVPDSSEESTRTMGPVQSGITPTLETRAPSNGIEPGVQQSKPVLSKHLSEIEIQPLSQATTGPVGRKQGEHFRKPELEASSQNNGRQQQLGNRPVSEIRVTAGTEIVEPLQSINSTNSGTLADSKIPVAHVSDLVISGVAVPNASKTVFSTATDIRSVPDISRYHDIDVRFAAKSKAILVQMDFPELGKITARFGGLSEAISLTLTANDEDLSPALAEVQREMKTWLDQVNVESIESAQYAEALLDDPEGFPKNASEQESKGKGQTSSAVPDALNSKVNHGGRTENDCHPISQSARKWRLI